jgi:endoglucanase
MKSRMKYNGRFCAGAVAALMVADVCAQQSSDIRLNQIGFYPTMPKVAIIRNTGSAPFSVIDVSSQDTVFRGTLTQQQQWPYSGETVSRADFSDLTSIGRYVLAVPGVGSSSAFDIKTRVHQDLALGVLKGYYYQRASLQLTSEYAGIWARALGHPDTSVFIHPSAATAQRPANSTISAPRGWYDAGDYNKYIVNSGISTYTILATYEHFPAYCARLNTRIPESANSIPDILDEALWNLRWMLTMQDPNDGGVYHKLTNANFDGWIMPVQATTPRYLVMKSTAAALDFAAVMAQSARIFRDFSAELPGFADSCLQASLNAWNWARKNPAVVYNQTQMNQQFSPAINTGEYGDSYFQDEFDWAAAELYVTTAQESFLTIANPLNHTAAVPGWGNVRTLGLYSMAQYRKSLTSLVDTSVVRDRLLALANSLRSSMSSSAYSVVMGAQSYDFVWGSNGVAANQGMALLCAYQLTGDSTYLRAALANLDYLLGRNGTTYCFVTGFGSRSPMYIHHRPSQADNIVPPVPGLLAGGPNPKREDSVTTYPSTMPALSYTDNFESYASNEICINWNAPLVFLAVGLEALTSADGLPTGVSNDHGRSPAAHEYGLMQNYPNPFSAKGGSAFGGNPSTTISYELASESMVSLKVFNILGEEVATLADGRQTKGPHLLQWNGRDRSGALCSSGVYFLRLEAGGVASSKKMILAK